MSNHYTFTSTTPEGKKIDVYGSTAGRRSLTIARNFTEAMRIGERLSTAQPANEIRVVKNGDVIRTFGPVDNNFGAEVLW